MMMMMMIDHIGHKLYRPQIGHTHCTQWGA